MKDSILVTHIDLDGVSCALLAIYFRLDFNNIVFEDNDYETKEDSIERILAYDNIIFTDLSPSEKLYKYLISLGKKVWIYDHHKSSEWCKDLDHVFHDKERCGTKIFFDEYIKKEIGRYNIVVDRYVDLVDIYDRYRTEDPSFKESLHLNYAFYGSIDKNQPTSVDSCANFMDNQIYKFNAYNIFKFSHQERREILRACDREETLYRECLEDIEIRFDRRGKKFGIICLSSKKSIVAYRLLQTLTDLDYIIIINTYKGIDGKFSCRARRDGNFNCIDLKAFKGHEEAAGYKGNSQTALDFVNNERMCPTYNDDGTDLLFWEVL